MAGLQLTLRDQEFLDVLAKARSFAHGSDLGDNEQRWAHHAAVAFISDPQNGGEFSIEQAVQVFAKTGHWSRHAPVSDVSQAPPDVLAKFGLTPEGRKL